MDYSTWFDCKPSHPPVNQRRYFYRQQAQKLWKRLDETLEAGDAALAGEIVAAANWLEKLGYGGAEIVMGSASVHTPSNIPDTIMLAQVEA